MSKCDFRVDFSSRLVSLPPNFQSKMRFAVELPRGLDAEVSSAKCDWRVSVGSLVADGVEDRLQALKARFPGGALRVSSDKCDWSVSITPSRPAAPTLRMASDKCDFAVNLGGGRAYRLAAAPSDKCDSGLLHVFDPVAKVWKALGAGLGKRGE